MVLAAGRAIRRFCHRPERSAARRVALTEPPALRQGALKREHLTEERVQETIRGLVSVHVGSGVVS